jgi:hypothetical protein
VVVFALAGLLAGCGSDDERAERRSKPPELTVPRSEPEPRSTETNEATTGRDPATAPLAPGEGEGDGTGAPAPQSGAPDSPQNDTPPPPGSPAERFEQECDRNPEACG